MKSLCLAATVALLASACTFTPQSNGSMDASFHPPIVANYWKVQPYTLGSGDKACAISSGYNGLTVLLSHPAGREEGLVVESNRRMEPGATLTVSAGGNSFQASDHFFPAKTGRELVRQLAKGGTAYLEWSELSGPPGMGRMHIQNIVQLDDFAAQLKQCEASFAR